MPAGARQLTEAEAEELRLRTRQALLALGMLVSGTANTLTCKATLSMVSAGGTFDHPFVMSGCMFSGEILCLLWFRISSMRSGSGSSKEARAVAQLPKQIFALPAICDIVGTSVMYLGLTLTTASTYQMLRGSVIIFTGALSATYLRRKQWGFQWTAMFLVFMGVLVVGSASSMIAGEQPSGQQQQAQHDVRQQASASTSKAGARAMLGNALVVFSQLFTALQMCLEERFVTGYNAPALVAVGWEGVWGLSGVLLLLVALQTWTDDEGIPIENSMWAMRQIAAQPQILLLMGANALSIAFFNFFGMSITKSSSAAYRMVLDSLRTIAVWLFDIALGGGGFHPLQLVGFALMFGGASVYNEAIRIPCCTYPTAAEREEAREAKASQHSRTQALLGEDAAAGVAVKPPSVPLPLSNSSSLASDARVQASSAPQQQLTVQDFFTPTLSRFTMQKN